MALLKASTPTLSGPVAAADRNATAAAAAAAGAGSNAVVTPGDVVHVEGDYLRGHGTYNARATQPGVPGSLLASVAGSVERVNKLVSVRAPKHRYVGEVGDVVVGRIVSVGQRSWRVDIGARQTAVLQLSSVTLPGGAQRRRTQEDRLAMRSFLREGDLVSAEVQTLYQRDGCVYLASGLAWSGLAWPRLASWLSLSIYLYLSIYIYLSIYLSPSLSISISISMYLSIYLCIYLSLCLSISLDAEATAPLETHAPSRLVMPRHASHRHVTSLFSTSAPSRSIRDR